MPASSTTSELSRLAVRFLAASQPEALNVDGPRDPATVLGLLEVERARAYSYERYQLLSEMDAPFVEPVAHEHGEPQS